MLTFAFMLILLGASGAAWGQTSAGPVFPTAGANVDGPGTEAWTVPGNITVDDISYATVNIPGGDRLFFSEYLQGTGYGFNVPTGATIHGIEVSIMRQSSSNNQNLWSIQDASLNLVKAGTITGEDRAEVNVCWPEEIAEATYGSPSDLWGTTWTAEDINNAGFGLSLSVTQNGAGERTASVDYITIKVTYTPIAPPLTLDPSSLDFGEIHSGEISVSSTVQVSGTGLIGYPGDMIVTAPSTDFQVSNNNTVWGATTTIPYTSSTLSETPVYVRFTPQTPGAKSGSVTFNIGGGISPSTISLAGTGIEPATQLAFVGFPSTAAVSINFAPFTVEARRPDNTVDYLFSGPVTLAKVIGPGNLSGTLTVAAVNGVAAFNAVQVDQNGEYNISASSGSLAQATGTITVASTSGDYASAGSGLWSVGATWLYYNGSAWVTPVAGPTNGSGKITIFNSHTVTVATDVIVDQVTIDAGGRVNVSTGVSMTIADGPDAYDCVVNGTLDNTGTLTPSGAMVVNNGGLYLHSTADATLPTAVWNAGSTCEIRGWISGSLGSSFNQPFYNFTWNCSGQNADVSFNNNVRIVTGTFTLASSAGYVIYPGGSPAYGNYIQTGGYYQLTNSLVQRTISILNDLSIINGTFAISGAGLGTVNVQGDISLTGGIFQMSTASNRAGNLNIAGNFSHTSGTITTIGEGYVNFMGQYNGVTGIQTYNSGGTVTGAIYYSVNEGAFLQMAEEETTVTGDGGFILYSGSTLGITSTNGIALSGASGNIQAAYREFLNDANYVYNGTVNQTTGTGLPASLNGKLIINNTGEPLTNEVTLNNACTIAAGGSLYIIDGIFNAGTNLSMSGNSAINRNGGVMSGILQGAGVYNVTYTGDSMSTTSELSGSGLNSMTVSLTGDQVLSLGSTSAPDGDLIITSGIFDLGAYTCNRSASGGALSVSDGATLKIGGTSTLPANYSTSNLGPTSIVEYNGAEQVVSPVTYGHLVISGTAMKTIEAGAVTVAGDLATNDLLKIRSWSTTESGSLIVAGTTTGNVTYNRMLRSEDNLGDRHFLSSPVSGMNVSDFQYINPNLSQLWEWQESNATWPIVTAGSFISGKGYNLAQTDGSLGEYSFTGSIVKSATYTATSPYKEGYTDRSTPAAYGVGNETADIWAPGRSWTLYGGGGWNLIGNPFTSAMDAATFITANSDKFDPNYQALYVYDGINNRYLYAAASVPGYPMGGQFGSNVQTGQGFYVLALYNNVIFNFNQGMQVHNTSVEMLKSASADNLWPGLELRVKFRDKESFTTIVYNDGMSTGNDPGYDVGQLSTYPDVEIYTSLVMKDNSVNFARQALPLTGSDKIVVPVGIDTEKGGEVTFSAFTVPLGDNKFWLEDRTKGIFTDLNNNSYTVTLPANTYGTGRFFIIASTNTPTGFQQPEAKDGGVSVYVSNNKVIIKGEVSDKAICEVYDLRGKKILETKLVGGELNTVTLPSGSKGVYLVRVVDEMKVKTSKVAIL